ncbi:MAG: exosortase V [Novosphingobium sp.]|nr:exosortase V [Novosphingobium sp.]
MATAPEPAHVRKTWTFADLHPFLLFSALVFALPTLIDVARMSWSTEQGGHGPIVVATGLWLIGREWPAMKPLVKPGSPLVTALLLVPGLLLYAIARITGTLEVESFVMFFCVVVAAYSVLGGAAMGRIWFPLIYLLFSFPPPDTIYAMITQPLKIGISGWSVGALYFLGYPVASSGVVIQIGQYQLLVAAACAGVNSMISLTALGLFYSYIRYRSHPAFMTFLILLILPTAVLVNIIRVIALLLITYYFGGAAGQGFFHDLAGISMFLLALSLIFIFDWLGTPLRHWLEKREKPA